MTAVPCESVPLQPVLSRLFVTPGIPEDPPEPEPGTAVALEVPEVPARPVADLSRRPLSRCALCKALAPNHLTGCTRIAMPDPGAQRCGCGYPPGSLGCKTEQHREGN